MMFPDIAAGAAVAVCVYTDVRKRLIYNRVIVPMVAAALLWHIVNSGWTGLWFAAGGFFLGVGVLLLPYLAGGIGAGDVKMMGMLGAWQGPMFTGRAVLLGAVAGGVLALVTLIRSGQTKAVMRSIGRGLWGLILFRGCYNTLPRLDKMDAASQRVPYGLALGLGTLMAWLWG